MITKESIIVNKTIYIYFKEIYIYIYIYIYILPFVYFFDANLILPIVLMIDQSRNYNARIKTYKWHVGRNRLTLVNSRQMKKYYIHEERAIVHPCASYTPWLFFITDSRASFFFSTSNIDISLSKLYNIFILIYAA